MAEPATHEQLLADKKSTYGLLHKKHKELVVELESDYRYDELVALALRLDEHYALFPTRTQTPGAMHRHIANKKLTAHVLALYVACAATDALSKGLMKIYKRRLKDKESIKQLSATVEMARTPLLRNAMTSKKEGANQLATLDAKEAPSDAG